MKLLLFMLGMFHAMNVFANPAYYTGAGEWKDGRGEREGGYARFLLVTDVVHETAVNEGKLSIRLDLMSGAPITLVTKISAHDAGGYRITDKKGKQIGTGAGGCLASGDSGWREDCKLQMKMYAGKLTLKISYTSSNLANIAVDGRLDGFIAPIDFKAEASINRERTKICGEWVKRATPSDSDYDLFINALCMKEAHP